MVDQKSILSLRGPDGRWRGMTTSSLMSRGDLRFKELINCYVSPDGTEIRRFPGFKAVANIDYKAQFIDSYRWDTTPTPDVGETKRAFSQLVRRHGMKTCRGKTLLIGEADYRRGILADPDASPPVAERVITGYTIAATVGTVNYTGTTLVGTLAVGSYVLLENITGTDSDLLMTDGPLYVASVAASFFTVTMNTSGSGSNTGLTGNVYYVRQDGEPNEYSVWTIDSDFDVDAIKTTGYQSQVANRQRDWADTVNFFQEGHTGVAGVAHKYTGTPRRKQMTPPHRACLESAGDRILMATPGHGVIFQAPVVIPTKVSGGNGVGLQYNSYQDRPRALGVPKGVMFDGSNTYTAGASPGSTPDGTYRFRVAYKDEYTGEVGMASEEVEVTTSGSLWMQLHILHPGYLMGETLAFTVQIYASEAGGTALGLLLELRLPEYGQPIPTLSSYDIRFAHMFESIQLPIFTASDIDFSKAPPISLNQMPMGAKACRVVRGHPFFGGSQGTIGLRGELEKGQANSPYTGAASDFKNKDEVSFYAIVADATQKDPFNMAAAGIPPAYAGMDLFSDDETEFTSYEKPQLYPVPAKTKTLDKLVNCYGVVAVGNINQWLIRWKTDELIHRFDQTRALADSDDMDSYLKLPKGQIWYSEQGKPGVAFGVSRGWLNAEKEEDVEGIGRYGNSVIFCTRNQTFSLSWNQSPLGASVSLVSSEHGCIAYNSMVEFDGGLAWMSSRGPVAIGMDGVQWIGRDLEGYFVKTGNRYSSDSKGLMPHCWSCHDKARGLIYFGVITSGSTAYSIGGNIYSAASDEERSKFPCDEVLVWSYRNNAWSVWQPPIGIFWMENVMCADGVERVAFWGDDDRVYVLDDGFHEVNKDPLQATASVTSSGTTITVSPASWNTADDPSVDGNGGAYDGEEAVVPGMNFVVFDPDTFEVRSTGVIATVPSTTSFTSTSAVEVESGDLIMIGATPMTITMNSESVGGTKSPARVTGIGLRYSQFSDAYIVNRDSSGILWGNYGGAPEAWAQITGETERGSKILHKTAYKQLSDATGSADVTVFERGTVRGHESSVKVQVFGGQQTRISDIELQIGKAGS